MKTAEEKTPEDYWDENTEYIGEDIDSLNQITGRIVLTEKRRFIAAMESYAKEQQKYAYLDTEADGFVYCGKCGGLK